MTSRELAVAFERAVQIINPEYFIQNKLDTDTIFHFLNSAQLRFVKLNYMSVDSLTGTVKNLNKANDSFKALIVNKDIASIAESTPAGINGKRYSLPSDFFLYLRSFSRVSGTYLQIPTGSEKPVPNRLIENEEVAAIMASYLNIPILRYPCCTLEATLTGVSTLAVYTDTYTTIKDVNLTYIRKPDTLSLTSNPVIAENVHQDIVDLAVEMFVTEAAYRVAGGDKPWRRNVQEPSNTDQ